MGRRRESASRRRHRRHRRGAACAARLRTRHGRPAAPVRLFNLRYGAERLSRALRGAARGGRAGSALRTRGRHARSIGAHADRHGLRKRSLGEAARRARHGGAAPFRGERRPSRRDRQRVRGNAGRDAGRGRLAGGERQRRDRAGAQRLHGGRRARARLDRLDLSLQRTARHPAARQRARHGRRLVSLRSGRGDRGHSTGAVRQRGAAQRRQPALRLQRNRRPRRRGLRRVRPRLRRQSHDVGGAAAAGARGDLDRRRPRFDRANRGERAVRAAVPARSARRAGLVALHRGARRADAPLAPPASRRRRRVAAPRPPEQHRRAIHDSAKGARVSTSVTELAGRLSAGMDRVMVGADRLTLGLTIALLARGHVLIEGVPGTGKTLAVRALALLLGLKFRRIGFTPDLMPSDVVGTTVFNPQTAQFTTRIGPIAANVVLADEVNRTPPKTQSALLEAMEEGRVTIDGVSYPLPQPFLLCATQNPIEYEGTYPLPEAQLDRFTIKVTATYPQEAQELKLLARSAAGFDARDLEASSIAPVSDAAEVMEAQKAVRQVHLADGVRDYTYRIVAATRSHPRLTLGASPRAGIALLTAAQAAAAIAGRDFATPDDVKDVADFVIPHRLIVAPDAEIEGISAHDVLREVLAAIPVPRG